MARGLLYQAPMELHSHSAGSFADSFWSLAQREQADHESQSRAAARAVAHVARVWAREGKDTLALDEPAYAAPEALRGEPADRRAGIFTLGVLLFERVTNQHPFGENLRTRIERMRRGELGPAVGLFTKMSEGLRPILTRALAPEPEDRFESLEAFAFALEHYADGPPSMPSGLRRKPEPGVDRDRTEIIQDAPERARMLHEWTIERERIKQEVERRRRRTHRVIYLCASALVLASVVAIFLIARG